jgi:hypothetical protein
MQGAYENIKAPPESCGIVSRAPKLPAKARLGCALALQSACECNRPAHAIAAIAIALLVRAREVFQPECSPGRLQLACECNEPRLQLPAHAIAEL